MKYLSRVLFLVISPLVLAYLLIGTIIMLVPYQLIVFIKNGDFDTIDEMWNLILKRPILPIFALLAKMEKAHEHKAGLQNM